MGNYVNHLTSVHIYKHTFYLLQFIYSWHIQMKCDRHPVASIDERINKACTFIMTS